MSAEAYIHNGTAHQKILRAYVHDGTANRRLKEIWAKQNGVWRRIYRDAIYVWMMANSENFDLWSAAGSPTEPVLVVLTNDRIIYSASTSSPALDTANMPTGSIVVIKNKGWIYGANGNGGDGGGADGSGGFTNKNGEVGTPGGPAINAGCELIIDNTSGYIFGGGGGGGGGGAKYSSGNLYGAGGGGGLSPGAGGDGTLGGPESEGSTGYSSTTPYESANGGAAAINGSAGGGTGGKCYGAGYAGQKGENGSGDTYPGYSPGIGGLGGAVGRAIDRNSFDLTITGGENAAQLKGAYD